MNKTRVISSSFQQFPRGQQIEDLLSSALMAVDPAALVRQHLDSYFPGRVNLPPGKLIVIGAGKAALKMAEATYQHFGERISAGLVIAKDTPGAEAKAKAIGPIQYRLASHPIPDRRGVAATAEILALLSKLQPEDMVLSLISGGGSALLTQPAAGLSLDILQAFTQAVMLAGANIQELNRYRRVLDNVKAGGLARAAFPARMHNLILSDVMGDSLAVIASGPTDLSPMEPFAINDTFNKIIADFPDVQRIFNKTDHYAPPPPNTRLSNHIIGNNATALQAAADRANALGFQVCIHSQALQGEAREVGRRLIEQWQALARDLPRPLLFLAGGETTVTVKGSGRGGPNQELVLSAFELVENDPNSFLVALSTDGEDGPTNAAGAILCADSVLKARQSKLMPQAFLKDNNAFMFFDRLDALVYLPPGHTNVNDLVVYCLI